MQKISPMLWFDNQAEEAATLYTSIFPNSRILSVSRYGREGQEIHGRKEGSVMTVAFEINGQAFTALNGGPLFRFTEAVSFVISCSTQEEVDHYWEKLTAGGDPNAQQCGWLKDRFGLSWQVIPTILGELLGSTDRQKANRVMKTMLQMKKMDIKALRQAAEEEK